MMQKKQATDTEMLPTSTSSKDANHDHDHDHDHDPQLQARLEALKSFSGPTEGKELSSELESVISDIADIGASRYPWGLLKAVLVCKLDIVVSEYRRQNDTMEIDGETFETRYDRVVKCLQTLERPPFTLQRMCELLTEPMRYYNRTEKFFLAFSKMVCGISYPAEDPEAIKVVPAAEEAESAGVEAANQEQIGTAEPGQEAKQDTSRNTEIATDDRSEHVLDTSSEPKGAASSASLEEKTAVLSSA